MINISIAKDQGLNLEKAKGSISMLFIPTSIVGNTICCQCRYTRWAVSDKKDKDMMKPSAIQMSHNRAKVSQFNIWVSFSKMMISSEM